MQQTLTIFVIVVSLGSIAVMVGAGVAGSYIIRGTMKPLERVSAVATDVAHLDLEEHTISSAVRVEPRDSDPRTEVGAVGYALNQLLDNVNSALEVRERTEHQIRAFIADASHELRTPLAAIKATPICSAGPNRSANPVSPPWRASTRRLSVCPASWKTC